MPYTRIGNLVNIDFEDYASSDNNCIILTMDNSVMFCGNIELEDYTAYFPIGSVNEGLINTGQGILPVTWFDSQDFKYRNGYFIIDNRGVLRFSEDVSLGTVLLEGVQMNCQSAYYNSTLGNNVAGTNTSPLDTTGVIEED